MKTWTHSHFFCLYLPFFELLLRFYFFFLYPSINLPVFSQSTHIDHSIGSDAEEGGPLVDRLDLLAALHGDLQALEFAQRALQSRPVLGDQVVARAEVVQLADQDLQGALDLVAVRLRRGLLVSGVI